VVEQGQDCQNVGSGVSCRPGQLGVPSDFVFCPAESHQSHQSQQQSDCDQKNKKKSPAGSDSGSGFLFNPGSTLHSIVTGVSSVTALADYILYILLNSFPSVPETVREIIRGNITEILQKYYKQILNIITILQNIYKYVSLDPTCELMSDC